MQNLLKTLMFLAVFAASLSQASSGTFATFSDYCRSDSLSSAELRTLQVLSKYADIIPEKDDSNSAIFCEKIETYLKSSKEIFFGGENPRHPQAEEDGIWSDNISDIRFLVYFDHIEVLSLSGNDISDWSPIKNLKSLRELSVLRSQLESLNFVTNLKNLEYLDVRNTRVHDLSPLSDLPKLAKLGLSGSRVNDLSPLKNLVLQNLELLWVDALYITDWDFLLEAKNLKHLRASEGSLDSLVYLRNSPKIEVLVVNHLPLLQTLDGIESLKNLSALGLASTKVKNFSPLVSCEELKNLRLDSTTIDEDLLKTISELTSLQELSLVHTEWKHIKGADQADLFFKLRNLKSLDLRYAKNLSKIQVENYFKSLLEIHENDLGESIKLKILL